MNLPSFQEDVVNLRVVAYLLEIGEVPPTELVLRMLSLEWVKTAPDDAEVYSLTPAGNARLSSLQ
jgi:hypothetical protein